MVVFALIFVLMFNILCKSKTKTTLTEIFFCFCLWYQVDLIFHVTTLEYKYSYMQWKRVCVILNTSTVDCFLLFEQILKRINRAQLLQKALGRRKARKLREPAAYIHIEEPSQNAAAIVGAAKKATAASSSESFSYMGIIDSSTTK